MTRVLLTRRFEKDLDRVPEYIRVKVMEWVELIESFGLQEIRKRSGYHDEPLKGNRAGQRSVRMSLAYRLLYRETDDSVEILLLEVNKHEY